MGLTRLAITRPLAVLMFILGLVMMGVVSYRMLHVDRMPNISFPFVSVSVSYPGASPEDVETLIAKPIEAAVAGISGVTSVSSTCASGRANISLQLAEGTDANQTAIDVARKLASIGNQLPSDASTPVVNKADPNSSPIMNISLSGQRSIADLYDIAVNDVQPPIQSVLGVADASVVGGLAREVQVNVDYTKLEAYGLTLQQLTTAMSRENVSLPAGSVTEGTKTISVRSLGYFQSIDELKDLIVGTTATGPVFLRDVADVTEGYKTQTRILRLNGQESVGLRIIKQSDANSLQVADDVRKTVARIQRTLPPDVRILITNDTSRFTRAALDSVQNDLAMAIFLTAIVLLLFLHTWRNTLIVILAIPTSLLSTFLVMYALGFSLNTISMMALALTVGILVDDSIVVLENIHRHLRLGEVPRLAALKGRSEIGMAAMAITFTDVVVYLPVAFMQGNIGQLFRQYGLTIAAATLFSLLVSFTLTPMLASRWLKAHEETEGNGIWSRFTRGWERNYERVASGYGRILAWALHHRPIIVAVGVIVLVASVSLVQFNIVGSEYAPQEDDSQFSVNIQMPPGTSLQGIDAATKQVEAAMSKIPEVQTMYTSIGSGGGGFMGGGGAGGSIDVQLVDKSQRTKTVWEVINEVRRIASGIPEVNIQASVQSPMGGGGGGGFIQIRLAGDDLDTLASLSGQIEQVVRGVPGILDVRNGALAGLPEVRAVLDRKRMAESGVTAQQVGTTLRTAVSGSVASVLRPEGKSQEDITVRTKDADKQNTSTIAQIPLTSVNGAQIRLGQIANLVKSNGPSQIVRTDGRRVITISGIAAGRPMGDVARDVRLALNNVPMPDGYTVTMGGQVQQLNTAFNAILSALGLSVILIYMLMVALYESWLYPLAIMFSLPVALVGAFTGLLVTHNTFNIFSMIGMIMLMGLVAKNAILLVDYTNTLRARGKSRTEAIVEAGQTRLRPILMTTATILFAMLPLAMKFEAGAESRAPMAVVIMGGVVSSTLLTLVLVPVVYTYLDGLQARLGLKSAVMKLSIENEMAPVAGGAGEGEAG